MHSNLGPPQLVDVIGKAILTQGVLQAREVGRWLSSWQVAILPHPGHLDTGFTIIRNDALQLRAPSGAKTQALLHSQTGSRVRTVHAGPSGLPWFHYPRILD